MTDQLSQLQQNISIPNNSSNLAQVNVSQPSSSLATNPSIITNPKTQALAQTLALRGKI